MPKERIAIIGAGLMEHGLAAVFANAGHEVAITTVSVRAELPLPP
jgi:3-hydroxyacyl-CoA dehydrogenase